jgi:hypothetical protein
MIHTASGRSAFILAVGLLIGFAGPSKAADPWPDPANVTAPGNPADAQAAPANQAAPADQAAPANPAAGNDQLSDADRAARQDEVRTPVAVTQPETPAARANPVVAGSQSATWDETSLIGKIFIGFGALLTVASAARMFMA